MLVCNGETPCPTLYAQEGDIVELHVHNDLYAQSSIHWYVFSYITVPFLGIAAPAHTDPIPGLAWHISQAQSNQHSPQIRKERFHTKQRVQIWTME
jgi:FtsP/CotA-like multicopper oxidase with cupredoxin domain